MNQHHYVPTHNFPKWRGYILNLPHVLCCLLLLMMFLKKSLNVLKINIYVFQTKIMMYVEMTRLMMMHNRLRLQESTITVTCHLLLNIQKKLQEVINNHIKTCICQFKKNLHQVKNICVFKQTEKVLVLHSVQNHVCQTKLLIYFLIFIPLNINV